MATAYQLEVRTPTSDFKPLTPELAFELIREHLRKAALVWAPTENIGEYVVYSEKYVDGTDHAFYRRVGNKRADRLTTAAAYHILTTAVVDLGFGEDDVYKLGDCRYRMVEVGEYPTNGFNAQEYIDAETPYDEEAREYVAEHIDEVARDAEIEYVSARQDEELEEYREGLNHADGAIEYTDEEVFAAVGFEAYNDIVSAMAGTKYGRKPKK